MEKLPLRFTREVRDLVVAMFVAVSGAAAAYALASFKTEPLTTLVVAIVVALLAATAAVLLKSVPRPSEDPAKNGPKVVRRTDHRDQDSKTAVERVRAPAKPGAP
ncbi:MAG TPA: hypothetical protein PKV98_09325 [Burkholderiaceae bacterium]|nr:hypothetical protein [Burkholderiaceae bacterium]